MTPKGPRRLTARQRLDRAMGGDELATNIITLARMHGWRAVHHRAAQTAKGPRTAIEGDVGFPDVILSRGPVMYAWECKRIGERMRPGQNEWLHAFAAAGVSARVVRPDDWDWIAALLVAKPTE